MNYLRLGLFLLFLYPINIVQTWAQTPQTPPASFADLAENLLPAVVNISSTQKAPTQPDMELEPMPGIPGGPQFPPGSPFEHFFEEFMERRGPDIPIEPESSLGSGFIIDAENGYVITNNHVIRDAENVRVTFQDDTTVDAKIIGRDEKTDIAVLKIDPSEKSLTAVEFGNSDALRVGDWIIAIGNPFGLGGTVTAGIISARQRDINAGPYDDFLQTDASINRGNSGGPMFNLNGEVIGINTAIFSPSGGSIGIGFAIPSSLAESVIEQIIEYGHTRRGWLGVRIQQVTDEIAESLGLAETSGALVASVTKGGPSEAAGLRAGDIILSLNGRKIEEMRELPRLVAETQIDSKAKLTYWRDGKERIATIKIGELEKAEKEGLIENASAEDHQSPAEENGTTITPPGFTLSALTPALRSRYGIADNIKGVLITDIAPRSEAAKKGLYEGDILIEINQSPVETPEDVQSIIAQAQKDKRSSVLLLVNRESDSRFLTVKIEKKKQKE